MAYINQFILYCSAGNDKIKSVRRNDTIELVVRNDTIQRVAQNDTIDEVAGNVSTRTKVSVPSNKMKSSTTHSKTQISNTSNIGDSPGPIVEIGQGRASESKFRMVDNSKNTDVTTFESLRSKDACIESIGGDDNTNKYNLKVNTTSSKQHNDNGMAYF